MVAEFFQSTDKGVCFIVGYERIRLEDIVNGIDKWGCVLFFHNMYSAGEMSSRSQLLFQNRANKSGAVLFYQLLDGVSNMGLCLQFF